MTTVFVYEDVTATWAVGDAKSPVAQSLLAEGRAMLDAVVADFSAIPDVRVLGGRAAPVADSPDFSELARFADYTLLIAPETAGRLEQLARDVIASGGRLLGPTPDAIQLTADKLALSKHWHSNGIETPRTCLLEERTPGTPFVMKPRYGAGSQGVTLHSGQDFCAENDVLAQDYVAGFPASVAFLVNESACIPLIPCQQILSDDGRFQYLGGRLPIDANLAERAIAIASAALGCVCGLAGYVGVDVVLGDDGRDWAIEINPRLTTSYVGLRQIAKFNIAEAMLWAVQGRSLPSLEWGRGRVEFTPGGESPTGDP